MPPAAKKAPAKKRAAPKMEPPARPTAQTLAEMDDFAKVLYYGPWGSGKTTALAHMAKLGRVIWINAEGGIKRRPLERVFQLPLENIELHPRGGGRVSYRVLEDLFWEVKARLEDGEPIAGVTFDSTTDIYKTFLEDVRDEQYAKLAAKAEASGQELELSPFFTDRSAYGEETEMMRKIIRRFRDLPCHFALSALVREDEDQSTKEESYGPALNPALQTDVLGWMDVVCRTSIEDAPDGGDDLYFGSFRYEGIKVAKDRYKVLPKKLPNPTFDRLVAYLNDDLTVDTDPDVAAVRQRRAEERRKQAERRQARRKRSGKPAQADEGTTQEEESEEE